MAMYGLYCALLTLWVLLVWPLVRLTGWARIWILLTIAVAILATLHEIRMFFWTPAAIRIDILLISMVLGLLYCVSALLLFAYHRRRAAMLVSIALVVIGGGMIYNWVLVARESQRLSKVFQERNVLLFEAKFRDAETYQRYFGPFETTSSDKYPIGHWQAQGASQYTRLIVNAAGRVWLFYQCQQDAECHSGPGGTGLQKTGSAPQAWLAKLNPRAGLPFDITVTQQGSDALSLEARDKTVAFVKTPPPVKTTPATQPLSYLGTFSATECLRQHAKVSQVWLWQQDGELYAAGAFVTRVAGRRAGFVHPIFMRAGTKEDDSWIFAWQVDGNRFVASIALQDRGVRFTLTRNDKPMGTWQLAPKAIFIDDVFALAPLTGSEDLQHWFDTVLIGHFVSGEIPAC